MANDMSGRKSEMVEQRHHVAGHLLDGIDAGRCRGTAATPRIQDNDLHRFREHWDVERLPDIAAESCAWDKYDRFTLAMGLVIKIDSRGQFLCRHEFLVSRHVSLFQFGAAEVVTESRGRQRRRWCSSRSSRPLMTTTATDMIVMPPRTPVVLKVLAWN